MENTSIKVPAPISSRQSSPSALSTLLNLPRRPNSQTSLDRPQAIHHVPSPYKTPPKASRTLRLPQSHRHNAPLSLHPSTAPTPRPSPQLCPYPLHRLHALERPLHRHRLPLSHRRRLVRQHGARVSARGYPVAMEPGHGYEDRGDCGV